MDDIELDNERHRREEQQRRAKRQKNRAKSKSGHQSERERNRREHAQKILSAQKKKLPLSHSTSLALPHHEVIDGGSSIFQSLFHERAKGFFIDLRFRNAPPRPPVGPTFVGLGLEWELTNEWTKYKARNAVENQYTWKLHPEPLPEPLHPELGGKAREALVYAKRISGEDAKVAFGVPLVMSAMDYEDCYSDPAKNVSKVTGNDVDDGTTLQSYITAIHPDDDALISWEGPTGDTAAEQLQQKQDRVRAAARLAIAQGYGVLPLKMPNNTASKGELNNNNGSGTAFRLKKHHLKSRILDEKTPNFMKKTTYLTNDATSVHRFTSLAHTQVQRAKDVDRALAESKTKYNEMDVIERGFNEANSWETLCVGSRDPLSSVCNKKRRIHCSKINVTPLWDFPLLPDVSKWGHTYTHVVIDNPPKNVYGSGTTYTSSTALKNQGGRDNFAALTLSDAIIGDVSKQSQKARMSCTVWVPKSHLPLHGGNKLMSSEVPTIQNNTGGIYTALQQYDLDVVPLRDSSVPPAHYIWVVDPTKEYAGYYSIGSRVQLSTGRPVLTGNKAHGAGTARDKIIVSRATMEEEDKRSMEMRMSEVDLDLAEKYGLIGEIGVDDGRNTEKGKLLRNKDSFDGKNYAEFDEVDVDAF
mmetsp:Transcript_43821/g.92133  ORF Transcript_43821/g.92133 Transcript_43821/m.92133 type:complete len:641 (+) Transcript_43821:85-2007(+)|eukprot:CAMPEP_0183735268 /NCGR_PEP_ID=MMETSP0737-20130205/46152_1 /TAXON_ID=385413 /ORGANISM="Thalassiosira miniscula, Strain CCMP1093" /LENGTH=640 /DNA_ID=CAMNT_0025968955 /DNA_START=61 /DNA_END=1983 /DNA_ORIENTATION=+